jgi:hypothetical protein
MTPIDLQDRVQYLSLALFAQEVISVLADYVDENESRRLKTALKEALISLSGAESASVYSQRAFASYEQFRTLEEVWKLEERAEAKRMIQVILRDPENPKAKPAANGLINLFSKLQDQALWNFKQPRPVSLGAMQKLCKLA